jgi:peptide/nickel transport system substrate-binding protein
VKALRFVLLLSMVGALILSACEPEVVEVTRAIEIPITVEVEKPVEVEVEKAVEVTRIVEGTPEVVEVTRVVEVDPRYGGIMKQAYSAAPSTLDSMSTMAGATCWADQYIYETLIAFGETYLIEPMLAESWDVSDDGLTYTFYLRKGIKFHNGEEMTSADVIASVDRFLEIGTRAGNFVLLESYEAIDDYTVAFHLSKPSGSFLNALAYPVASLVIMPKSVIEGKKAGELVHPDDIIGTGPYKLKEWKPDQIIVFERFDDYQPLDTPRSGLGGAKIAYFDEIQQIMVPEMGTRLAGLLTGEYDSAESLSATEYDNLVDNPDTVPFVTSGYAYVLLINHNIYPTNDVNFRKAVLAALDMDAIGMAMTGGQKEFYRANPSIWEPEGPWYVDDDPLADELYNIADIDKAKEYLALSGYNGEEIIFVTNRDYDAMYKMIVAVADQLERNLGLNVTIEVIDWPANRARWDELETWHFSQTYYVSQMIYNPDAMASFWYSTSSSAERGWYANDEMDAAFDLAAASVTFEDRYEAFKEVQRVYYETLPNIKIVELFNLEARRADIQNHATWYRGNRYWSTWREGD